MQPRRRNGTWAVALVGCALLAGGTPAVAGAHDEAEGRQVVVTMTEYRFSPDTLTLEAGVETRLVLENQGTVVHEFATPYLADLDVAVETDGVRVEAVGLGEVEVKPGHQATLIFTPEAAGRSVFVCGAKEPVDHQREGMRGTLVVR